MADLNFRAQIELLDRMTAPMRSIATQADRLGRQFGETAQAARKLQSQQGLINSFRQQKQALAETSEAAVRSRARLQQLEQQMRATANPSAALVRQFEAAGRESQRLNARLDSQRQHLQQLRGRLSDAGISTNNLANHERELARNIERTNQQLAEQRRRMDRVRQIQSQWQDQQSRWSNVRGAATGAAIGGALALSVPVRSFTEAEDAATSLKVSMMDASGAVSTQYQEVNALAERLGTSLPGSTADFNLMMQKLIQQGISAEKILGGVGEASANLAVLMKMPFDQSAEFAAKMQDATKTSADDMLALMDTIQRSYYLGVDSQNMLQGFSKLSSGMKTIRQEGLEGANAMAPLLIMADQASMAGESAGNAYSKIFKGMLDTGNISKALDGTGITLDFTDGNGEFSDLDNMYKQLEKLKPLSTEVRNALIGDIWGNDSETVQALNLLIDKGQAGYDETVAKMQSQADLQKRVNAQLGTLANIWDAAKGTFTSAMVKFGEALAPDLKNLLGFITDISEKLGGWAKENPELATTLMRIAGVLVAVAAGAAALSVVMLTVLGPIALLRTSLVTLGGSFSIFKALWAGFGFVGKAVVSALTLIGSAVKALTITLMANPILALVLAIAVLAFTIYKNWDTLGPMFAALWERIKAIFNMGIQALKSFIMNFTPVGLFIQAFAAVWPYLSGLGARFREFGSMMLEGLKNGILGRAQAVISSISNVVSRIKGAFTGSKGMDIHSPSRVFDSYGGYMMQGLGRGILSNAGIPVSATKSIAGQINDYAPISIDSRKSILPQRANTGMNSNSMAAGGNTFHFHINGATDPQAVAREVQRVLAGEQRNQMARERSRLSDID